MSNSRQTLSGSEGSVFLDGSEIAKVTSVEATITFNYEDVYNGSDVDRKKVSQTGTGTISFQQTSSISANLLKKYMGGKEPRFVIEASLEDKDAISDQIESFTLNNVSFDSLPIINWQKGSVVTKELPFRFTPTDMQTNSMIKEE